MTKTRNPVGWGFIEEALPEAEIKQLVKMLRGMFDLTRNERKPAPQPDEITLPKPRVAPTASCTSFASADHETRLLHAAGRSYRDLATIRSNQLKHAPDWVANVTSEQELKTLLEAADKENLAVIPFGGGSSVVGGVTPEVPDGFDGVVTLNLQGMNRVLDVDVRDRVVHAEGGILGPALDEALRPHGLTVRHYPQSYYHSSLGGWIATRGAGHFSTQYAKIEDRVASVKLVSPSGLPYETRPLPASSVAIDPNRLAAGSEGMLGVITEARLRVVAVPQHRSDASVEFASFEQALEAGRAIVQAGLWPTQMRILDPFERMVSALQAGQPAQMKALMLLSFESADFEMAESCHCAVKLAADAGGTLLPRPSRASGEDKDAQAWKNSFFRQPYMRDALIDYGCIADTFETAVPWHRVPAFYHEVRQATLDAVNRVCGGGAVLCRVTHAYPDGVALYFSFYGLGKHGELVEQWLEIKTAAGDAVEAHGGTASHHHAMGRDHRAWGMKELPDGYAAAVRGIKGVLDPKGRMNPGVWW